MKRAIAGIIVIIGTICSVPAGAEKALYGNAAAKADTELTSTEMLTYALEDEYTAHAEYAAVIAQFGAVKPFTSIIKAEETHIDSLKKIFTGRKIAIPSDEGTRHTIIPQTLLQANQTGVQAEIDNIAMYERFLKEPAINSNENADIKAVFVNLKNASEKHLQAFQRQL